MKCIQNPMVKFGIAAYGDREFPELGMLMHGKHKACLSAMMVAPWVYVDWLELQIALNSPSKNPILCWPLVGRVQRGEGRRPHSTGVQFEDVVYAKRAAAELIA